MRSFITLITSLTLFLHCGAQSEKAPLHFQSYAFGLCVNKSEQLVITTRVGEVAITSSIDSYWRKADPVKSTFGTTYDQPNFFNNDTGFVSGFVNSGRGSYDIIYHTIDGGKTWKAIDFGKGGWVDDAANLDNGEAWMSVSGDGIAYTSDYGFRWTKLNIPEPKQRFAKIYFNEKREGLIGSLWNLLAYTPDNCQSWKYLPTPLDQRKYSKINETDRPEIDRVAIFGDYFIVSQENLVFYSKRDSIDWNWIKGYTDFYTDAINSAIFFKTNKGNFARMDENLNPVFVSGEKITSYNAKCRNSSLFVMGGDRIMKIKPDNSISFFPIYTNETKSMEAEPFGYTTDGTYGTIGSKIYLQKEYNGKWDYQFTLPFQTDSGHLSMIDNKTILYQFSDSAYYFDLDFHAVHYRSKSKVLNDFCNSTIRKIAFNEGSMGCFHYYFDELIYKANYDGKFELAKTPVSSIKKTVSLPENDEFVDTDIVNDFVRSIPQIATKWASIEELGFREEDYDQCKKDILAFKNVANNKKKREKQSFQFYKNNLDFDKLINLVDTIENLDKERLNNILFKLSEMWSTTSNWKKVTFTNLMGEELAIVYNSYEPNALHFPWMITLNGFAYYNTSIEINRFIDRVYPGFLSERVNKMDILYTIVKKLYNDE